MEKKRDIRKREDKKSRNRKGKRKKRHPLWEKNDSGRANTLECTFIFFFLFKFFFFLLPSFSLLLARQLRVDFLRESKEEPRKVSSHKRWGVTFPVRAGSHLSRARPITEVFEPGRKLPLECESPTLVVSRSDQYENIPCLLQWFLPCFYPSFSSYPFFYPSGISPAKPGKRNPADIRGANVKLRDACRKFYST